MRRLLATSFALLLAATPARAEWLPDGNPVCTANGFQGAMTAFGRSGDLTNFRTMFVSWMDTRDTVLAGSDLYYGVIGPLGEVGPANGEPAVVAPAFQGYHSVAPTGSPWFGGPPTGVVTAWVDDPSGAGDVYAKSLFAQTPWPQPGVAVCTATGGQSDVRVLGREDGGAVVAWIDPRSGIKAVYAQRLDAAGVPQWTANGVAVGTLAHDRSALSIATGPDGGVYLGWQDSRSGFPRTYVTLLKSDGTPAAGWLASGNQATNGNFSLCDRLVADGNGGVFVTLMALATPAAQRLDANGFPHAGWGAAGRALSDVSSNGGLVDAIAYDGGLIATWGEYVGPSEDLEFKVRLQRLLGNGDRAPGWSANGVTLSGAPGSQHGARISDGPEILAVWADSRSATDDLDVYAMKFGDDGTPDPDWTPDGVKVAGGPGSQRDVHPVWDGISGTMIAYRDGTEWESDVYAQIVSSSGRVDVPVPLARGTRLAAPVPNPAYESVSLALAWPSAGEVRAEVHDAIGRRVRTLAVAGGGSGSLRWDLRNDAGHRVEPGVYFVRVRGGGSEASRTVIVRR